MKLLGGASNGLLKSSSSAAAKSVAYNHFRQEKNFLLFLRRSRAVKNLLKGKNWKALIKIHLELGKQRKSVSFTPSIHKASPVAWQKLGRVMHMMALLDKNLGFLKKLGITLLIQFWKSCHYSARQLGQEGFGHLFWRIVWHPCDTFSTAMTQLSHKPVYVLQFISSYSLSTKNLYSPCYPDAFAAAQRTTELLILPIDLLSL